MHTVWHVAGAELAVGHVAGAKSAHQLPHNLLQAMVRILQLGHEFSQAIFPRLHVPFDESGVSKNAFEFWPKRGDTPVDEFLLQIA